MASLGGGRPTFPEHPEYVAVDDTCRDRLIVQDGVPEDRVRVLLNFVDLERFPPRAPLPRRPVRALLFCNEVGPHVGAVREACANAGIHLDTLGSGHANVSAAPETVLEHYDIIFGKARSALEGLAVGAAVILVGANGMGSMVTTADVERLRRLNFGVRALTNRLTPARVTAAIERYDPLDAAKVSSRIRASAGRDAVVEELLGIYRRLIAHSRDLLAAERGVETRAAAAYLRSLVPIVNGAVLQNRAVRTRVAHLQTEREELHEHLARVRAERDHLTSRLSQTLHNTDDLASRLAQALHTTANMERSLFWRARLAWVRTRQRFLQG